MGETKNRIEWIDLAKGICIVLVVLHHVASVLGISYPFDVQARGFRMPLYFILSGLFFKQYEGFVGFLKRKTNKLLIPFLFFLVTTSILPYWILILPQWASLHGYVLKSFLFKRVILFNEPIWFLLCLFEVNLLFYLVQLAADAISSRYKTYIVLAVSLLLGCGGLALAVNHVSLMFYADSALSALPLFAFGWWLFRHTSFLKSPVMLSRDVPMIIICALILWLLAVPVKWINNDFSPQAVPVVYLCGIAGTMMVLTLSKIIKRLPLLSYWGRYSIMILCVHYPIATVGNILFGKVISGPVLVTVVFLVTLLACHFLIPVMKRFFPHVTAQKDLIRVA